MAKISTKWACEFNEEKGIFEITIHANKLKQLYVSLPPDEFLGLVKYLGTAAIKYTHWLKNGGVKCL